MTDFLTLVDKVRKDPLGPMHLNQLRRNAELLRTIFTQEHSVDNDGGHLGEHNVIEIPRVCARISDTTITGNANFYIQSVSHPSAGVYVLSLMADIFTTDMRVQVNVSNQTDKPWCAGYEVVDSTTLKVRLMKLESALGAGNVWGPNNADFDIAIHSDPILTGDWPTALPDKATVGMTLDTETDVTVDTDNFHWNRLVTQAYDLSAAMDMGHDADGLHEVREVARFTDWAWWDPTAGGSYRAAAGTDISFHYISTGICEVHHSGLAAPRQAFVEADFARVSMTGALGDIFLVCGYAQSSTSTSVYMYKYDTAAHTWARANCDFFIALHG